MSTDTSHHPGRNNVIDRRTSNSTTASADGLPTNNGKAKTTTRGRPKGSKSKAEKRQHTRSTKFSKSEDALFAQRIAKSGMTPSEFIRTMCLKGSVIVRKNVLQASSDENIIEQLLTLGRELNRIALLLNAKHSYMPADLQIQLATHKRLMKQLKPLPVVPRDIGLQILAIGNNLGQIKRALIQWQSFIPDTLSTAIKSNGQVMQRIQHVDAA